MRAITSSTPPTRPSPSNCPASRRPSSAAGCSARRAADPAPAGLRRRLEDLVAGDAALETQMAAILQAARALPGAGLAGKARRHGRRRRRGRPRETPSEAFLAEARALTLARLPGDAAPGFSVHEVDLRPVSPGLLAASEALLRALARLDAPMRALIQRLEAKLADDAEELEEKLRQRIEATCRGLRRRALERLVAWQAMLRAVAAPAPEAWVRPDHVMYLSLDRREAGGA